MRRAKGGESVFDPSKGASGSLSRSSTSLSRWVEGGERGCPATVCVPPLTSGLSVSVLGKSHRTMFARASLEISSTSNRKLSSSNSRRVGCPTVKRSHLPCSSDFQAPSLCALAKHVGQISMELAEMERDRRTGELRRRLREVQAQFLPSRAVYMPVGRSRHRVYRIAVEVRRVKTGWGGMRWDGRVGLLGCELAEKTVGRRDRHDGGEVPRRGYQL